ncbi:hypothetical protein KSP40_PGU004165 [Platanthera guangdongensis]|uniref:Uncharacterized protein n=1 Tax=Platanthera guangdongensis TaxID=2320717 RepID=A0ABR2MWF7_9ASPA
METARSSLPDSKIRQGTGCPVSLCPDLPNRELNSVINGRKLILHPYQTHLVSMDIILPSIPNVEASDTQLSCNSIGYQELPQGLLLKGGVVKLDDLVLTDNFHSIVEVFGQAVVGQRRSAIPIFQSLNCCVHCLICCLSAPP